MSILDQIFEDKRAEVKARQAAIPLGTYRALAEHAPPPRNFVAALKRASRGGSPALIAEVKRRSPSRGILAPDFDPVRLACLYASNGAAAISVLTDAPHFGGELGYLGQIQHALGPACPPLLRKDFLYDAYQVYEARAAGADAILLIAAALAPAQLHELHNLAQSLGMAAMVEVHEARELDAALGCQPALIGINNRNLHDFNVDLRTTLALRPLVPPGITVVAESGIRGREDMARLAKARVDAVLIGEGLVTAPDVGLQVRLFTGTAPSQPLRRLPAAGAC